MNGQMTYTREFSGAKLNDLRIEKGLTQNNVADALGVKWQNIYRWEKGGVIPSANTLVMLADALGVSMDSFFIPKIK